MIKKLLSLCILFIMTGCTEEVFENTSSKFHGEEFYASFEGTDSRTYVDEQIRMRWTAEDKITLFKKNTYNREFIFTGKTGANAGGFRQISVDDEYWFGYDVPNTYAVYPHSAETTLDETDLFLTVDMPAEQTYVENSFGLEANTMVAISSDNQLIFKNVGSYLRVRLYGKNTTISAVTLTSKGKEAIAGEAKITPVMDGNPTCEMLGTEKSIRLVCPTPVTISTDINSPTEFWIVVPPVTLANGFSVTVENSEGNTQVYNVDKSFTFERNVHYQLTREISLDENIPYVTFTADAEQIFTMSQSVKTLEYSVNGGEWTELGTSVVNFGGGKGDLRLRGKNESGTGNNISYSQIKFGNEIPVECSGDIRTLLDFDNYLTVDTRYASFYSLFKDCSSLKSAPNLPATNLNSSCYHYMFYGCTNLTTAPELPATNLTPSCYSNMFYGCSSLTTAPKLPATTLASSCYNYMFGGCSNLTAAPELPATTLAPSCYYFMFGECSSLTVAPELPATTLADNCYTYMFHSCTSLVIAPKLPATILTNECYEGMFYKCTSLVSTPELPATTMSERAYCSMFSKCSSLTSAPKLPAVSMAPYCYGSMFSGCSSLESAPELPAFFLAEGCYGGMFSSCTSLTSAPELPATILLQFCYKDMFYNCSNLTYPPKLSATTLAYGCYEYMFYNCSSLVSAPELPASKLEECCYFYMFSGCTKLNNVTMLATDISAEGCLDKWIGGVSSTGTFTKAKEMNDLPKGSSGIPSGWAVRNYGEEITAVDLGLSVKWGSCNLGANSNFDTGDRYAWGETSLKQEYTRENYAFYDVATGTYTNIGHEISGTEYDAASATLDNGWRMPTYEEWEELNNNCTAVPYTDSSGFYYAFRSNINNNVIYLPATYSFSNYWTSTAKVNELGNISGYYSFYLNAGYTEFQSVNWPYQGYYIRPVYDIE